METDTGRRDHKSLNSIVESDRHGFWTLCEEICSVYVFVVFWAPDSASSFNGHCMPCRAQELIAHGRVLLHCVSKGPREKDAHFLVIYSWRFG